MSSLSVYSLNLLTQKVIKYYNFRIQNNKDNIIKNNIMVIIEENGYNNEMNKLLSILKNNNYLEINYCDDYYPGPQVAFTIGRFSVLPKEERQCYENDYIKNHNNKIILFYHDDLKFIYSSILLDNIADNISGCKISEISYNPVENEATFWCMNDFYTRKFYTKKLKIILIHAEWTQNHILIVKNFL